jgi:hypothetical protein
VYKDLANGNALGPFADENKERCQWLDILRAVVPSKYPAFDVTTPCPANAARAKRRIQKLKQRQLGDYKTYKKKRLAEWYPVCAWLGPFMLV